MSFDQSLFSRGSEWRQWDLHIHTPASFHWKGQRFEGDATSDTNRSLVDEMIAALNAAEPAVFALMDYWTFDGWFALKKRLKEPGAPVLNKTVFPGIELRIMAPMPARLNAHVLFSNEVDDQVLHDFKSALTIEFIDRPLSNSSLIQLARKVSDDKIKHHGFKKHDVDTSDEIALQVGSMIAELNCDSYKKAIEHVPFGQAIGFMPYDTNDGLADIKREEHYSFFFGLVKSSTIFESRNAAMRSAFIGEATAENAKYIDKFQRALGGRARLVVAGSDAHCFKGVSGDNDRRGYGDFPSGKATWIKADPTFRGLIQATMEPVKRSFIGDRPPKLRAISENKTFFMDSIAIQKIHNASVRGEWLNGVSLPLNPDLVAIIGNKGSGKSALADVLALLGNSRQKSHFSFLKRDRFRGKSGDPARNFIGKLTWLDANHEERNLNDDPPENKVELVRYIPQGHFEELCNSHVSGQSDAFENELRSVIFSHAGETIRLGALDFDQLIEQQESGFRHQLNEFRKDLSRTNQEIMALEGQLQPAVRSSLNELLSQKNRQIEEHQKIAPIPVAKPDDALSPEQQGAADSLDKIAIAIKSIEDASSANAAGQLGSAGKIKSVQNIRERLRLLTRAHQQFLDDTASDMESLGLNPIDLVQHAINSKPLDDLSASIAVAQDQLKKDALTIRESHEKLSAEKEALQKKLNAPQLLYQQYLAALEEWETKLKELVGTPDEPETYQGIKKRLAQLDDLPKVWSEKVVQRSNLAGDIFDVLDSQRRARESLFMPVQDLIQSNRLIRDEYKLQFQATLGGSPQIIGTSIFGLIKQNSGEFRGEDESYTAIRVLAEKFDFNQRSDVLAFTEQLHEKIVTAANGGKDGSIGINSVLRKDRSASEVYDFLFGLSFLEPRYSLLFQDAQIEQLSPGQRGALLLIFYLLVDKGQNPIILDQPEENLDNETVVSLLVPVLTEAKKRRQIIMVTHNPNLAVVCDSEQIIWSAFDRKNSSTISYIAGAIENPNINGHVVTVLEGTMPAFTNRSNKYH